MMQVNRLQGNLIGAILLILLTLTGCWSPSAARLDYRQAPLRLEVARASSLSQGENQGRLAYIGNDGNVYVTTAEHRSTIALTNDAESCPEHRGFSYHRIAWSRSGWLAFAAVTREGDKARSKLFVVEPGGRTARLVAESDKHFVAYLYWSPVPCPRRPACQHLAYLIGEDDGTGLHLIEIHAGGVQDRLLDVGRPLFFSWSTDGRWMLWQTGSGHDDKRDGRMVLYDVERNQAQILDEPPGSFATPAWSPVEGAWLAVLAKGDKNQLRSFEPDGATVLVATADSDMAFSWSPTGKQVAYAMRESGMEGAYGPIHILDLGAGRTQQVTADAFRIVGFFWAPDGQRLGYLTRMDLGHTFWAQWRTIDLVTGQDRGFAAFNPSPWMWFRIRGFTQYAQSHRFWSPDGRYLVYSDRDNVLVDHVWLIDTWADRGTKPIPVDGGVIGTWSWDP